MYLIGSIGLSCLCSCHHPPDRIIGALCRSTDTEAWVSESDDTEKDDSVGGERGNCC